MFERFGGKSGARSTDGFEFQFTGRFTAEYREGDRVIDLEVSGGEIVSVDNAGSLHWRVGSHLSTDDRSRVLANIKAALEFMDLKLWEYRAPFK